VNFPHLGGVEPEEVVATLVEVDQGRNTAFAHQAGVALTPRIRAHEYRVGDEPGARIMPDAMAPEDSPTLSEHGQNLWPEVSQSSPGALSL
jgi:hypothetical protein